MKYRYFYKNHKCPVNICTLHADEEVSSLCFSENVFSEKYCDPCTFYYQNEETFNYFDIKNLFPFLFSHKHKNEY